MESNDITFFSEITRLFLAGPAITRSVASSISLISIFFLSRRAATKAASFNKFSRSAPENPGVRVAIALKLICSSSGLLRACTFSTASRHLHLDDLL